MKDLILYRNEWYEISEYHEGYVILKDELGNNFQVKDKDIEILPLIIPYA